MTASDQATLAATFVDEWVRAGVTDAVVAPGSRSTPLVLALATHGGIRVHTSIDERSAAFFALGMGLASGEPAIVVTTSGTAAAELHPAVIEAHHARVPLVLCTADRPAELHDVGAPQTITQTRLFEGVLRWSSQVGTATGLPSKAWRSLASRAVAEATGHPSGPGPVHLNIAFDDPLVGDAGDLPAGRPGGRPWHAVVRGSSGDVASADLDRLRALAARRRGVIVAGAGCGDPVAVLELGSHLGWPVLADARSGCRTGDSSVVAAFDSLLRVDSFAQAHTPDLVLRVGSPPASKVLGSWLAEVEEHVVVDPHWSWVDPDRRASLVVRADPATFCYIAIEELAPPPHGWDGTWEEAEAAAQETIEAVLARHPEATEPGVARALTAGLRSGTPLFVSSSMPIRDVEWYGHPGSGAAVFANRGANGIDGVVSTAAGVAARTDVPVVALLGDLAFLHDSNGLIGADDRAGCLVLVVVDNDGGGIFSFLPQAGLPSRRFEQLFATPHGLDLARLAGAFGLSVSSPDTSLGALDAVERAGADGGVHMVHVRTERGANVALHEELHSAVAGAVSDLSRGAK